jgi:alkylhydroperoxidase family enzyme
MPVIEPVPWEDLDEELRTMIEDGLASGMLSTPVPSQIFGYRPELAKNHLARNRAIYDGVLDERLRELVRLRMAAFNDCEPCLAARKSGDVDEDDVRCLASDDPRFSERERLAIRFAELFVTDHLSIDRACYEELGKHFDKGEIISLAMHVAGILGTGRLTHTLQVFDDAPPVLAYDGELSSRATAPRAATEGAS